MGSSVLGEKGGQRASPRFLGKQAGQAVQAPERGSPSRGGGGLGLVGFPKDTLNAAGLGGRCECPPGPARSGWRRMSTSDSHWDRRDEH